MFGFNYYEDQQFQAQAKASAKAVYDNREWSGTGDQAKETPWYKKSLQEFDYNSNVGYLAASGLKAVEDVGKGAALLGGGLVATVHESGGDHPLAQALFEVAGEPTQINVDPEKAHWAFRTVGDIGRTMLPFFIPGIGVATGTTAITARTGIDSLQQGLDVETAQKRALIAGGGATAMAAVAPLSGKALNALLTGEGNAMLEVIKSFALNMGLGQAQRTADWAVVKQKYPELAEQLEVFGPTTVGLDIAMWGLFAGMGYRQVRQQLVKAGVPVTEASRAIRVAEEIIGADSAVNDAVYVRRQAKTIDDGPLLSPEAYDVQLAMVDDVMARLDNAEPLPVDVPDNVALKPVEQVPVQDTTGLVLLGGREGTRPALPREEVTKFVTDFGLDQNRVVIHDIDNPLPDFILKAAEREGGTATSTEAWLGRDGTLHINLDAFDNVDRLKDVVGFHEITHRGQDVELLAEVQRALPADQFLRSQVERMATERNYDLSTKEGTEKALKEATAEAMMDAVYRGKVADAMNQGWFSSVVNKVKQVLRDLGVKIEYTDEDAARLVGTMWQRGKERMTAKPEVNQWRTIYEALQDAKYIRRGVSKGKNYTESDFQNHLKEFYPSVYDGAYRKDEVLAAVKNMATNSSRRLTDRQREIISNFEYDLGRVESQMVDVPFSIAHAAPYLRELDAALARRGAEGEHAILDDPVRGRREVITEIKRNGKVIGYQARQLDRSNRMFRSKVDSALASGESMGVLGETYGMEDRFAQQYGLDLEGVYVSDVTRGLAKRGGSLPAGESERILVLKAGREDGNHYNPTPEEMKAMQAAKDNAALVKRYENFLDQKLNERAAENQRRLEALGFRTTETGGLRPSDAGGDQGVDNLGRDAARSDLTPTQQLDAAMSGLKSLEADDVDFSIALDKDLPDKALQAFGRTFIARAAGYIMPDGQMLDFSGHHYGDPGTRNTRNVDHRELSGSSRYLGWGEFDLTSVGGTEGMFEFMNQSGAVRWMPEANAVSITAPLTRDQAVAIIKAYNETKRYNGQDSLLLGADHPHNYSQIASLDMQRPTVDKILAWSHEVFPVDIRTNAADFSIQPPLPETNGTTGRTAAADSYLKRLVQATENQITVDEAAQIVGTVEKRYDYLTKRTAAQADILTEFKRMGIAEFFKAKPEEYLAMSETERKWALTKAELLATLTGKKEAIRRQKITAETVQREKDTVARMASTSGRNMVESWIDRLMGEPSGKGEVQPWINKAMGIEHEFMAHLAGGIKEFDSWLGVRMSPEQELLLARELHQPGSTGDSAMKKAADHIRTTFDAMRTRANKSGADIGYIEGYYPQAWNSRQVMLFGQSAATIAKGFKNQAAAIADAKSKWVDFMLQRVDRNHPNYIDEATGTFYTDDQMKAFLGKAFDTISTNGAAKGMAKQGKGSLAASMASERQLHFKDAESWVEANKLFGQNDLLTSVVGEVARRSRDIALLEMFGPNPDRVHQEVLAQAVQTDSASNWFYNRKVNFANALWMEVTGTRGTAGTGMVADAAAAARQGLVFSRLGAALLSQLGDLPIFHAMAVKSGMPEFASMLEMARTLNPAKVGDRAVADTFEFGLSALHDDVMSRVMDTTNGKGLSAKLAKFTMRAGGMQWWADRMAHGAKLLLARGLYQMHGKRFEDQSPGNLALLKRSGITADEWNRQILNNQSIVADFNGREVMAPHLIEDAALREKLWGLIERESTFMALRPDEKTRALIKGSAERGGMEGELRNSMFLFRSFTAAMIQKVAPRLLASLPGESRSKWMYTAGSFMIASTLMAAMSTQLKEINKGRMPRDMEDTRFWAQAFGQAWNLGVIGDLLWGENNRFGQNVTSTIAGPVAGLLEDIYKVTLGNMQKAASGDDIDPLADAVKMIKNYATPNLWYLRPALDQFLWWPLQEMANPGYLQRSQDRIERENKTKFWLPPTGAERY